ncbi:hypothetical protein HWV07_08800 [Natronomonas salina]|uniref:rod-determining factor RdfA n=1 Tax=Natronomonas salina TaxID=1710540 RepID=UPI0015B6436D|nr:rod-determining factor RdfA [Natronomonas salina]QLD89123.1 hypothetical protein HWV07_08800 [Natronomonas salina]
MTQAQCKIDIVCDRYGLDNSGSRYTSVDDRLLNRWTGGDGRSPDGYRTLTEWFNKRLLKSVYDKHGRNTTGKRISSDYQALRGDDDLLREEVMDDLRADGINPERVCSDMVSYSTMREHLNSCLEGEKQVDQSNSDWEQRSLEMAKNITRSKVREALSSLDTKDVLPEGDEADIEIQILLSCPECPIRIPIADAVERGFVCKDHFQEAPSVEVEG